MGFELYSEEQRVRITLSQKAFLIINEDMERFHISSRSTFMNTVFHNFYPSARSSPTLYMDDQKAKLQHIASTDLSCSDSPEHISSLGNDEVREKVVKHFLLYEEKHLLDDLRSQMKTKGRYGETSRIYRINTENLRYLLSEECEEAEYYQDRPGLYLKCILEEYAALPYIKREHIFFKSKYDIVSQALREEKLLKITTGRKTYKVWPFSLEADALSTREYLTGLSQDIKSPDARKSCASFRIPNAKDIKLLRQSGKLTQAERELLKEAISSRTVQFLFGEEEEIHVRLTEEGIHKYNSQIYMRPAYVEKLADKNEYIFRCTLRQAEYYFFKFGKDAEILSPDRLRSHFQTLYKDALAVYSSEDAEALT